MIIQCEQCRTKFKLDDEKVTERGARVRCAKCRHIFTVRRPEAAPQPATSLAEETVLPTPTAPPPFAVEPEAPFDSESRQVAATVPEQTAPPAPDDFDFGTVSFADLATDTPSPPQPSEPSGNGIDFGTILPATSDTKPTREIHFDFGEATPSADTPSETAFDFGRPDAVTPPPTADLDFGGFDFGELPPVGGNDRANLTTTDFSTLGAPPTPTTVGDTGLDFGFGEATTAPGTPTAGLDFSALDFGGAQTPESTAAPSGDAFNLGELDFSTVDAPVPMPALQPEQDNPLFTFSQPPATTAPTGPDEELPLTAPATPQPPAPEETPPLSIASRRRQNPLISALILVAGLLLVGVLAFMGYLFLGDGDKAARMIGAGTTADEGRIVVQKIQASFLTKATAGDLLVITGEALNRYGKPRAALQVKGTVFGPNNESLASQTCYAGNQLTREQLATMPRDKILSTMNNQFGDSLANLEVPPGKAIPFTLVIINPPANAKDFGVEAVGSTVAAGK